MTQILAFILFSVSAALTPGPNNFILLKVGLNFGTRRNIPHLLGICVGCFSLVTSIALGLGTVFMHFPELRMALKLLGAGYMGYLVWGLFQTEASKRNKPQPCPWRFYQGLLFQWVNPKAWIVHITLVSLFVFSPNHLANALILGAARTVVCAICSSIWLIMGATLQRHLKNERERLIFNLVMAASMIGAILLILLD